MKCEKMLCFMEKTHKLKLHNINRIENLKQRYLQNACFWGKKLLNLLSSARENKDRFTIDL